MATHDEKYYEELAEAAERGEFTPVPGTALTGEAARLSALAMLKAATGTDDYDELVKMTRGRRKLSEQNKKSAHSPVLHLRLPEDLNDAIRNLATQRGESTSEVARELLVKGLAAAA